MDNKNGDITISLLPLSKKMKWFDLETPKCGKAGVGVGKEEKITYWIQCTLFGWQV